ncbi:MAG: copper resistance protein NlpE [Endomicrobia bacterium]|nr:copper resistance protein NlpE [Endomicrobiia bacterium]
MRKLIIFLIPFIIAGCVPRRTEVVRPSVPKSTVKQVEAKAADMSQAVMLNFKELEGYFLRNDVRLNNEVNFFVIDNDKNFDGILGQSRTMANVVRFVDLNKNIVAVIAMKPSLAVYEIKIIQTYVIENNIYIEYEVSQKYMPEVGFFISNMKTFEIQRPGKILNVSFVNADRTMTVLPFGRRTVGSPVNVDAMLRQYTGRYRGTIPAADGPGISMTLYLAGDYTYRLEQTYINNPARTFETYGKWMPSEDLSFFTLDYDKNAQEQISFYFIDRNTIEKLDINNERIASSPEFYRLKK